MSDAYPPNRRQFLTTALGLAATGCLSKSVLADRNSAILVPSFARGLLFGGPLGDGLGGPLEFQTGPAVRERTLNTRAWPDDRRVTDSDFAEWEQSLQLLDYSATRPGIEPYGQWAANAPAGTMTDDTRHKLVLMRMLRKAVATRAFPIRVEDLAQSLLDFTPVEGKLPSDAIAKLNDEALREYRFAARWILGERDPEIAKPLERLWAGVANCSGQMVFAPLAAAFPGDPEAAYRATYSLDFVDSDGAKDFTASLVAGLSSVLSKGSAELSIEDRWQTLLNTMRTTDPFEYANVPFAGRPLTDWLGRAEQFANEADGQPAKLFQLLETNGEPHYWWDAHFTLLVPLAVLHFCNFRPLAAMNLTLDFGHDTDSYAQVLGLLIGAVHGEAIFPREMRRTINKRLAADYGESVDAWLADLDVLAERTHAGQPIVGE